MKPITNEQLEQFLKVKAPKDCPWCGHDQWATVDAEGAGDRASSATVLYDFASDRRHPPPGGYLPTLTMFCTNCGGVREIMRHVVEKWLEEKENGTNP